MQIAFTKSKCLSTLGDANASIYLSGEDFTSANLTNITTQSVWQEVSLFVKTSVNKSSTAKLELFLGGKNGNACSGFVCFDNVKVIQYSLDEYNQHKLNLLFQKK